MSGFINLPKTTTLGHGKFASPSTHRYIYTCVCVWSVYTHTTSLKSTENSGGTEMQHIVSYLLCFSPMKKLNSAPLGFIRWRKSNSDLYVARSRAVYPSTLCLLLLIFLLHKGDLQVGIKPTQTDIKTPWRNQTPAPGYTDKVFLKSASCMVLFKRCCCSQELHSAGHKLKQTFASASKNAQAQTEKAEKSVGLYLFIWSSQKVPNI